MEVAEQVTDLQPQIDVQFAVRLAGISNETVCAWVFAGLEDESRSVCVRFTDKEEIAALNRQFRHRDEATNVLAFEGDSDELLGDVVVCEPVAVAEAEQQSKALAAHCAHLVIHAVLHLRGFRHDDDSAAAIMERKEVAILKNLGIGDPYSDRG